MKAARRFKSRRGRDRRGFALVVTVALLAFLLLLFASLGTLTQQATVRSSDAQKWAQAKQNALLALDVAVGQLQLVAGPDTRVSAAADALVPGNHYTGVWDAKAVGADALTWLVSGNDGDDRRQVTPVTPEIDGVELVGIKTSGRVHDVQVPRRLIRTTNLPGQPGDIVTGSYAWWIGDQGVKAPVTTTDRNHRITFPPYDEVETRRRLSQQVALGSGPVVFEPRTEFNSALAEKISSGGQLSVLLRESGDTVGLATVKQNFHRWSPGNSAVLADSAAGGLRRDLSLKPDSLGAAFSAWSAFATDMEDPASPSAPVLAPVYPAGQPRSGIRRRYHFRPSRNDAGIVHGIAPVLSHFLLTFNIRTDQAATGAARPLEVRARWMATLWNPYTSALIPEDLQLEVQGLPDVQVLDDTAGGTLIATVPLNSVFGSPLTIALPWQTAGRPDQQSWLPGRTYSWTSLESLNKSAAVPSSGFSSQFYVKNFNVAGQGVQRVASAALLSNAATCHLMSTATTNLTLSLYRSAGATRELLAKFHAPEFTAFSTTPAAANSSSYQFSFFFRLLESIDTVTAPETWLSTAGQDPRAADLPAGCFVPGANGNRPELYVNFSSSSYPDRLLDRSFPVSATSSTGQSFNEDTPLFELPRAPQLSMGALQHLQTAGTRPFAIGNSWGGRGGWNALFDRYFFSGASAQVDLPELTAGSLLPNPALRFIPQRNGDGLTRAQFLAHSADGFSSAHLLQDAAFNVNSVDRDAWLAVLRSGRHVNEEKFTALNPSVTTGTGADSARVITELPGAVFFRFSQSAQETATSAAGYAASTNLPPSGPNVPSLANTHLFRKGVRALAEDETGGLADAIATLVGSRLRSAGPFRSLEEFLNPSAAFLSTRGAEISLLEKAIELAGLNTAVGEFSSQWLTQADVMTALAPVLFARSDTFLIRTFGESINPVTAASEARVWAEAVVQRYPDYVDPTQPPETAPDALNETNRRFGRRFKIISFRWLTSSDL